LVKPNEHSYAGVETLYSPKSICYLLEYQTNS